MRDPNRLDRFYEEFNKVHKIAFPDFRFGQLISNFFGWIHEKKQMDFWFIEEDKMIDLFKEYTVSICKDIKWEDL